LPDWKTFVVKDKERSDKNNVFYWCSQDGCGYAQDAELQGRKGSSFSGGAGGWRYHVLVGLSDEDLEQVGLSRDHII